MQLLLQPNTNLIPERVDKEDLSEIFKNYEPTETEIHLCWDDLVTNSWDNAEVRADLGKALAEQIIWDLTLLKALERVEGTPAKFTPAVMAQVFYEHYSKGYHNADFEMECDD